jgi:hypothetical protein
MNLFVLLLFFSSSSCEYVNINKLRALKLRSVWESPELQPALAYIQANSKVNRSKLSHHSRIINGKRANLGDFPFHVLVETDFRWQCGGSLISEVWVLTVRS